MRIGCEKHGPSYGIHICPHISAVFQRHGLWRKDVVVLIYRFRPDFIVDRLALCLDCARTQGLQYDADLPDPDEFPQICRDARPGCINCLRDAIPDFGRRASIPSEAFDR